MPTTLTSHAPAGSAPASVVFGRQTGLRPPRRSLLAGLFLSLAVHAAFSFWPAQAPAAPEAVPLQATLTEMPPPPKPVAAPMPSVKPKTRPHRATALPAPQAVVPEPEPEAVPGPPPATMDPTPEALAAGPERPTEVVAADAPHANPEPPARTLPPRIDLVYKAFLGTQGFLIGEATYRFEHAANEYHIATVGEARGIAALFLRGQGKVESHGIITPSGLQPQEFSVERGSKERHETALFDWEIGIVTLHEQKTAVLELPTFDPLALMWQAYFAPPVDPVQTISVATTRRVGRYTITREAEETIAWGEGEIATERWHRASEDGKTDGWVWLAPGLRYVPVKMRVTNTNRGTLEALLDSIRVDEKLAQQ